MIRDDLRKLPDFSRGVALALSHEVLTDPDLFVLTVSGLCMASRSRPLKGLGIAMAGWFVARKADTYVMVIDSKMSLIAALIDAGKSKEANGD